MKHTLDRRSEMHVRDLQPQVSPMLLDGRIRGPITNQPVRCLHCKKLVTDPTEETCEGDSVQRTWKVIRTVWVGRAIA